jgi:hypothetical protein
MTAPVVHGDITPLYMQPTSDPADPAQICYGASDYRLLASAIFPGAGIVSAADWQITSSSSAILNIATGTACVTGTSAAEQHSYICRNAVVKTIQPPGPPATNNRYDLICLTAHDGQVVGDHVYEWQVQCLSGAEAASPSVPALPKDSIALAACLRRPAQANILAADITDLRTLAALPSQAGSTKYQKVESTTSSSNFSTTEARDTTMPYMTLVVQDASKVYRLRFIGVAQNSVAGRIIARIRDGGSGNPTISSAVLAAGQAYVGAGANNNSSIVVEQDMTLPVGTHTLGIFGQASQAGNGVLVGSATSRKQLTASIVG